MRLVLQTILILVSGLTLSSTLSAQTALPSCKGQDVSQWHACRGVLDDAEFSYAGDFARGKFEGRGILEFTAEKYQGDYFQGEFKNGLKHGFGIYFFANGEKYVGLYQYGKREGKFLTNGNSNLNTLPRPGLDDSVNRCPKVCVRPCTMAKPSPRPLRRSRSGLPS